MSQSTEALATRLESIIREKVPLSDAKFLDAFGELNLRRGKGCADSFATLTRLYEPRDDFADVADDVARLLNGHPVVFVQEIKRCSAAVLGFVILLGAGKLMGSEALAIVRVTGVAGLAILLVFYLFKPLIQKTLLAKLGKESSEKLIHKITAFVFIIALLAVLAWGGAEVIRAFKGEKPTQPTASTTPSTAFLRQDGKLARRLPRCHARDPACDSALHQTAELTVLLGC